MQGETPIPELEPRFAAECGERTHEGPRLFLPAPAQLRIREPAERIERCVDVRTDAQPEVIEIVAGVDNDAQAARWQYALQPQTELCTAHAAGQYNDRAGTHRNRSSCSGRIRVLA